MTRRPDEQTGVGGLGGTDVSHSPRVRALRWPQYFDRRIRYCGNHLPGLLSFRIRSREPYADRVRTPAHRLYGDQIGLSSGSREWLVRVERPPTTGLLGRLVVGRGFRDSNRLGGSAVPTGRRKRTRDVQPGKPPTRRDLARRGGARSDLRRLSRDWSS